MSGIDKPDDFRWMTREWIATVTPGRRLKTPFTAGEDDVYALPAGEPREGFSCATKGEGRGNGRRLATTTTSVGGAMGGATS